LFLFYIEEYICTQQQQKISIIKYICVLWQKKPIKNTYKHLYYSGEMLFQSTENMIQPMNDSLSTNHQAQISRCLFGFKPKAHVQKVTKQTVFGASRTR